MSDRQISHFTIKESLGVGGMGEVYLAHDSKLERSVAIKLLPLDLCEDETLRKRFVQEARSASALNHPNVCTIHEVGETESGQPYICMEFVDGQTLEDRLRATSPLAVEEAVQIASQVLSALTAAHQKQIVHRDLKPGNISINSSGVVKILDFGLAKRLTIASQLSQVSVEENITVSGAILGTPNYMSPEQASGVEVDHLSDLFSLGVILYEMLTGRRPFAGNSIVAVISQIIADSPPSLTELNSQVPKGLEEIVFKAISKKTNERFQTPGEMLSALQSPANSLDKVPLQDEMEVANSDVYISYSGLDDQALGGDEEGWISRFHRNLKVRLQQLSGRPVKVYRPNRSESGDNPESSSLSDLSDVKSLLTVVSPPFANSSSCLQEVNTFIDAHANADSRLVKVVKMPIDEEQLKSHDLEILQQVRDHKFFEQDESGRVLEYQESFGEDLKRRYYEKIYDVAHEINQTLYCGLDDTVVLTTHSPVAYVASTTSDIRSEYEIVCRELTERGYQVVPDKPLPLDREELLQEVKSCLEKAELVVQLVGPTYGIVPENSQESILELQSNAIRKWLPDSSAQQFVWFHQADTEDQRQDEFIGKLRSLDAAAASCELVEGRLSLLKEAIAQHLASLEEDSSQESAPRSASDIRMVYLICDRLDEDNTAPLEDYLFQQGFEVSLSNFDCPQEEVSETHRQALCECDAVIIFYGEVRKSWVDIKLRDTLKAAGYGRDSTISNVGVYIAPPTDKRKDRFKSHHAVTIQQPDSGFSETSALVEFLDQVKGND